MSASSRILLLLLYSIILVLLTPSINAQPSFLNSVCLDDRGNYTANSTYETNLHTLLSTLTSHEYKNATGFYTSSYGENTDKVYATGLCRGDLKPEDCRSCLTNSRHLLPQICSNKKEAIGWYRTCTLRYTDRYLTGIMERAHAFYDTNWQNVTSNVDVFDRDLKALFEELRVRALAGDSSRKFAAGNTNKSNYFETIYGLVQCSPDISGPDCNDCVVFGLDFIYQSCYGLTGVIVGMPSCTVAYDLERFYDAVVDTPIGLPPPPLPLVNSALPPTEVTSTQKFGKANNTSRIVTVIVVPSVASLLVLLIGLCVYSRIMWKTEKKFETDSSCKAEEEITTAESLQFNFGTIRAATKNFSDGNKLGQGGFGAVYRGRLSNGNEIAVKRLIKNYGPSAQGDLEFKNEVVLVARLGHRNLVNLLGFCSEKNERILVYEFVPNSSLDRFIFDPTKRANLDWSRRYKIISGIARGLLYLHEESHLRIIHRDLKAGNILLDAEMNPKICDFGTARLFDLDQSRGKTEKIVGTYGYMAPEYAKCGEFSIKSDVFSFGVLVLEIVCGRKVNNFQEGENGESLLNYVWKNWKAGKAVNLADPKMKESSGHEIVKFVHIGLLCVQEKISHRPTMGSVILMLSSSSLPLRPPSRPAYFMQLKCDDGATKSNLSENNYLTISENDASITELHPR